MKKVAFTLFLLASIGLLSFEVFADDQFPVPVASSELQNIRSFGDVVRRNWKSWSQGADTVSKLDLIARMAYPEYKGEDAAALVALEYYLKTNLQVDLAAATVIDDQKVISVYRNNVLKLRRAKRVLFANGQPTFDLLQQGPAGDCYFFSATGWMARYRPAEIMNAISQLDDGRYLVRFPNGDDATVTPPTDAELAVNDSDSTLQDGLWMSVLEKATGTIQSRYLKKSASIPDPTVAIDIGGVPIGSIVKRWSGREISSYTLGSRANRERVRKALVSMQARQSLATALLLHRPPAKLPYDHVYAIMEFNSLTDMVTIWNPWGTSFTPKGPSGPEYGYVRDKGLFKLTLDEFVNFYSFLAIEKK